MGVPGGLMVLAVIPARLGSTRLPEKALLDIGGAPMIVRTWERARRARVDRVIVATDSERIAQVVRAAGGEVVMTGDCENGTMRVIEAVKQLMVTMNAGTSASDIIVNVQGDEPMLDPEVVNRVVAGVRDDTPIATAAAPFSGDATDAARVKVVMDADGRAMAFSRRAIPVGGPFHLHVGVYAFSLGVLMQLPTLPSTPGERAEALEQLRWLENGLTIRVVTVDHAGHGVDTPRDLEHVRFLYTRGVS